MEIRTDCCKERSGRVVKNKSLSENFLRTLYTTAAGRVVLGFINSGGFSKLTRILLDNPLSVLAIDPFIKHNGISLCDYVPARYVSFNDFFIREILPGKRPVEADADSIVSPADGKISVCRIGKKTRFTIKNSEYTVYSLLRDRKLADKFKNGWFVLVRLSVDDFHHYIYSVSGVKSKDRRLKGFYHSVNPVVSDYVRVYKENSRNYSVITAQNGETVIQMEVGAMGVGKICNRCPEESDVKKGERKGHFEFGGSSVILLFQDGGFVPDRDLVINSDEGYETKVKMGEKIGRL